MPNVFHIDFETRSRADLKKVGAARYANDPSTEILCVAIAKNDEEPAIWCCEDSWIPDELEGHIPPYGWKMQSHAKSLLAIVNPDALVYAHNATFEILISEALWRKTFKTLPPLHNQWRCTMAMARRAGLPASLDKCSQALGLTQKKDTKGSSLIHKFCVPQKKPAKASGKQPGDFINPEDDPQAFKELCDYCRQDVRVEQEIHKKLHHFELKGLNLDVFQLTLDINTRGIPVNLDALAKADKIIEAETARLSDEFYKLTGFQPTQTAKVLEWLQSEGFEGANLKAETMEDFFESSEFDEATDLGRALTLKKRVSYASLKKIKAMLACAGPHDNRVRGTLNDYGAGTGRWSASLIQPQNFKRPSKHLEKVTEAIYRDIIAGANGDYLSLVYGPPLECISSCIRHFIHDAGMSEFKQQAHSSWGEKPPGRSGMRWENTFLDADYSAIEARIIAWQAQEKWRLDVFKTHGKIYEASAQQMFGTSMEEFDSYKKLNGVSHPHRQKGKVAELALGYQGGVGAMLRMGAEKEGLKEEELGGIVKAWREASPNIVQLWYDLENAAKSAVREFGQVFQFGLSGAFYCENREGIEYLLMKLPSGRRIAYPHPRLEKQIRWVTINKNTGEEVRHTIISPTPEEVKKAKDKDPKARLSDVLTYWGQIPMKQAWGRIVMYGGSGTNNFVQGIAADIMATGANNVRRAGYQIVSLIHDEALAHYLPGQSVEEYVSLLTTMPAWADGLPLAASGDIIPFYKKG